MGLKIGRQVFDDPGVYPVVEGGSPYGRSVLDDIHKRKTENIRSNYDNVGG